MYYYSKQAVEKLIEQLKLNPITTRKEQLKLMRKPMPEFNWYAITVDYENSSQERDLGTYQTYTEAIASIPYLMREYQYGFGDIHIYVYRPDPYWNGCFVEVACIYR